MAAHQSASGDFPSAPKFEKTNDVEYILDILEADLKGTINVPSSKHHEILERLRVHSASSGSLDPLLTKRCVALCCRYGFDNTSPTTGRIALRCLCNILLLAESTRQMFVDGNYPKKAVERMKSGDPDDELLSARLLLLCTYGTNLDFNVFFEKHHLAETINSNIICHARLIQSTPWESIPAATISSCSGSLKLLYNLKTHYPHRAVHFSESLAPILSMLNMIPIHSPPLQPPLSCLINCLIDLDIVEEKTGNNTGHLLFPSHNVNANVDRLTHILYLATESYNVEEMDRYGSPLVQVLLHIAESAPLNPKTRLQVLLLPSRQDRAAALGSGDSLPARLLRLSTAPTCNLGDLILALLFELSDKDPKQFIRNISYGFAAGFLLSRGVQLPENALESWTAANVDNSNAGRNSGRFMVNPTTGQRLDMEPTVQVPEMTDEEKEREAERLFVLFERLRSTGVVDVENPVAQAVHEGRLEELD